MTTITILKKDIEETDFFNQDDCAITRALYRAGLTNLRHTGFGLRDSEGNFFEFPQNESDRVLSMYAYLEKVGYRPKMEEPKDFTIELPI